jgi:hypothetical protein
MTNFILASMLPQEYSIIGEDTAKRFQMLGSGNGFLG